MADPINYNALDHFIYLTTYNDITFKLDGAQDGDFISIVFDNDTMTFSEGSQGDVQPSQRVASLATWTSTSQWGAETNSRLQQVFKDQQSGNYLKKAELKRISSTENTLIATSTGAYLTKPADYAIGSEASPRSWPLKTKGTKFEEVLAPA